MSKENKLPMDLKEHREKLYYKDNGEPRHVGVEIEYSNLSLKKSAHLIQELFGGKIQEENRYKLMLKESRYGDFNFELDAEFLQKLQNEDFFSKLNDFIGNISRDVDDLLDKTSKNIVPFEIAAPPIPIKEFDDMDKMVDTLRLNGALGTRQSLHYAFGVHFNVEPPKDDIATVLRLFKSFLILQKWIEVQSEVDLTRKISPFINDFPSAYIRKVIDVDYNPTKEEFLEDYIQDNPTRNRILDMLPMLAYWDEKKVRSYLPDEKINKRPTYHYRLHNSKVNQFTWSLSQEFQFWVIVELLANNEKLFNQMSQEFYEELGKTIINQKEWINRCHLCVIDLLSS